MKERKMMPNLKERRADLLNRIQELRREINILTRLECQDMALLYKKATTRYLDLERINRSRIN